MYTQCPECKKPHAISVKELSSSRGMISCANCTAMFDALELLNEGEIPADITTQTLSSTVYNAATADSPSISLTKYWGAGSCILFFLLAFQIYFFEAHNLSQNTALRPWLEKACSLTPNCQLPAYQNLDEISILNGSFETINGHYIFNAAFINQSAFAQKRPSIKLTLLDFSGQAFAKRVFSPTTYSKQPFTQLKPNSTDVITLSIAAPAKKIGGYRFELI